MGGIGERLGRWDDRTVVYRADDPEQRIHWRRLGWACLLGSAVFALLFAIGRAVGSEAAAAAAVAVLSAASVVAYVVWRRRRNRLLTGDPTKWPD